LAWLLAFKLALEVMNPLPLLYIYFYQ